MVKVMDSENQSESALDVIFQLKDMLKAQQMQISLLQKSVSMLDAKLNGSLFASISEAMPKAAQLTEPVAIKIPAQVPAQEVVKQVPRQNIKVRGLLQDDSGKNLHGVDVKISDANNKVVKQTKTNRSGEWMSFLPPGKYTAEFIAPGMQPDFRVFDLLPGQGEVDVS